MAAVNNLGTSFVLLFIVGMFMLLLNSITDDISQNPNLDSKSISLLTDIDSEFETNYNQAQLLATTETSLAANSTFEGVDAFYRSTAEDKAEVQGKQSTINKLVNLPSLFIKMFGIDNNAVLIAFNVLVYSLIALLIALQIYKAVRTGEVD